MGFYHCVLETRNQVFIVEKRFRENSIPCELKHISYSLTKDLCNLTVKFDDRYYDKAIEILKKLNFPGYKVIR
ncbi:MAG TPA: hypothetical protein GXX20_11460 [Clostridiaceae bacterium]|nr:hypothetical protein [Clostridiaceae bacterium]